MSDPRSREAAALLRLEIRRFPPEVQTEMQRLRMTALEMALPDDALWMFLPVTNEPAFPVRREASRFRRCTAGRLRIRARGQRRPTLSSRAQSTRSGQVHEDNARLPDHFMAPAGPAR